MRKSDEDWVKKCMEYRVEGRRPVGLLLSALAGDVHPNPGPPRYPCSVCFKNVTSQGTSYMCTRCSHWVHSRCSGLRNVADYRRANGIGNKQDGTKHLPRGAQRQSGGHSGVQAHGTIEKSQHPGLHPSTTGSTPRPRRRLPVFKISNSVSFTCKPLSTTSKNDPHIEELTISIAMDNTELLITNVYIPWPVHAMGVINHHLTTC